jgi:hypothetical protein
MMKMSLFAATAGLMLVSAMPPDDRAAGIAADTGGYPPCSRTIRDRCIQLYERGVRESLLSDADEPEEADDEMPMAADMGYPPCSAAIRDRCIQTRERAAPPARAYARVMRRAGERG